MAGKIAHRKFLASVVALCAFSVPVSTPSALAATAPASQLKILDKAANDALVKRDYSTAEKLYLKEQVILAPKGDSAAYADVLRSLALASSKLAKWNEAFTFAHKSISMYERLFGRDCNESSPSNSLLGQMYMNQGHFKEAEVHLKREYERDQARYGKDSPLVSISIFDFARVLYKQGKYEQAEPLFKRAIAIDSKAGADMVSQLAYDLESLGRLYYHQGRFAEADSLYKRSIAMQEKLGVDLDDMAFSFNYLADLYADEGRYSEAEPLYIKVLKFGEKALSSEDPQLAVYVGNVGLLQMEQGRYPEAEINFKRALKISQQRGTLVQEQITALGNLAELYRHQKRFDEAKVLFEQATQVAEKLFGPNDPRLAEPVHNEGLISYDLGDYAASEKLLTRSLSLLKQEPTPTMAIRLTNLGVLNLQQEKFVEAESYFKKAQAINLQFFGKRKDASFVQLQAEREQWNLARRCQQRLTTVPEFAPALADSLPAIDAPKQMWQAKAAAVQTVLSMMAKAGNDRSVAYAEGLQLFSYCAVMANSDALVLPGLLQSLSIKEKLLGDNDILTIDCRLQTTLYFQSLNGFMSEYANKCEKDLLTVADQVIALKKSGGDAQDAKATAEKNTKAAITDDDLENIYADLVCVAYVFAGVDGHDGDIQSTCERAGAVAQLFDDASLKIESLRKISTLNELTGDYGAARDSLTNANHACLNDAKLSYLIQLDLTRLALMQGDFENAAESAQAALKIGKEQFAQNAPDLLKCYQLLGEAEGGRGRITEAIESTQLVLNATPASTNITSQQSRASLQTQLGRLFIEAKRWTDAERILKESLAATEGSRDTTLNIQTAKCYSALGALYARQNMMQQAADDYAKAIDIFRVNLNRELVPAYVRALNGSAAALLALGDTETAHTRAFTSADVIKRYIDHVFSQLSFGEQCAFVKLSDEESGALFAICKDDKPSMERAYAYAAGWKGLLVESLKAQSQLIRSAVKSPELTDIVNELSVKRRLLAGVSQNSSEAARAAAKELEHDVETLEQKLRRQSEMALQNPVDLVGKGTKFISDMLRPDEAFVDVVQVRSPDSDKAQLGAAIISKTGFQFIDLGSESRLTYLVNDWRSSVTGETVAQTLPDRSERDLQLDFSTESSATTRNYAEATNQLRSAVWTKITAALSPSIDKVFLCSEGSLARVPWGAIVNDGKFVSEVDTPSEFVALQQRVKKPGAVKVFVAGDIDFNDPLNRVSKLSGTKLEIQEIEELAKDHQLPVVALDRQKATKENVINALTDASFAHLATHGFTRTGGVDNGDGARAANITVGGTSRSYARNPLLDTGLFVAFPQDGKSKSSQEELGILTASEIVGLDLSGCELVSLSACQTGLGRDLGGQGVLGLRSAIIFCWFAVGANVDVES